MRYNRSVPPCPVIPVLIYPDPGLAADWLVKAFGFTVRLRIANHRVQMRAGEGCFTIAEGDIVPNRSSVVQVRVVNVLTHCERARKAGAKILTEPKDHMYGERQYNAEDFYGHRWDFTETLEDVDPESWGGISVNL
ncbi:Glyoxalase family protein [Acidisarcina polymorpha]|uniref:Glyoxalase family protein n=1 Tax=Acidisarcina polymorpha TaxID=2211140 RepID=A0A2Z5G0U6_9BACT|nr:VOC family protein [Acidisarcina polymorpha]AXC12758.1 Glyoxalase family protein [Acidisarcina polymorpha]